MSAYITHLLGGLRITLDGYVPSQPCKSCNRTKAAAEFLNSWKIIDHCLTLRFSKNSICSTCEPPNKSFPLSLKGARFGNYYVDGRSVGWYQRDDNGIFGDEQSLQKLGLRCMENGVYRAQPKLDRKKGRSRKTPPTTALIDDKRGFSRAVKNSAAKKQGFICTLCDGMMYLSGTGPNKIVADHIQPHSHGYATMEENCGASHSWCNSIKGTQSIGDARRLIKQYIARGECPLTCWRVPTLFDGL